MKITTSLAGFLAFFVIACSEYQPNKTAQDYELQKPRSNLKLEIPDSLWEPIYFKSINTRSKIAGLPSLRTTLLANDDVEVRIWIGFGSSPLEGFIIKRSNKQWSGIYLKPIELDQAAYAGTDKLAMPKSGWETLWNKLNVEGIQSLPDSSLLGEDDIVPDGESYVTEINTNNTYRTYRYGVLKNSNRAERRQMTKIVETLYTEFGISR